MTDSELHDALAELDAKLTEIREAGGLLEAEMRARGWSEEATSVAEFFGRDPVARLFAAVHRLRRKLITSIPLRHG